MNDLQQLWDFWADGTVDGLRKRLVGYVRRKFPSFRGASDFAADVVAEAFDSAVSVISSGGQISCLSAWFYKTVRHIAARRLRDAEVLRERGHDVGSALCPSPSDDTAVAERDAHRTELVDRALTHATGLLPRVGTGQVREVMGLFLEAVRAGLPDYPPSAIADTLGISEPQARTLLHRGLARLRREAEREGLTLPDDLDPEPHEFYGYPLDSNEEEEER